MRTRRDGDPFDEAFAKRVKDAVDWVVREQAASGVDVVNDGEYTKRSWQSYARGRLAGIEQRAPQPGTRAGNSQITGRDQRLFPRYFSERAASAPFAQEAVYCVGPLQYTGREEYRRDIEFFRSALQGSGATEGFLSALAPGTIEHWLNNEYYKTDEEFLFAIADAMHEEYKAIADAGFVLQLDDPDLPDGWQIQRDMTLADYKKYAALRVEALNHAIRDIPEESVRLHICWGSGHHPHTQDIPLAEIIDLVYKVKAQCYSIEQANPRHEHEWTVFRDHPLPAGKILMPGIIGHAARDFVEHPEAVAQRTVRYAEVCGRENVIIGTDCGLSRAANDEVMWAKFKAAGEGARIATKQLWSR